MKGMKFTALITCAVLVCSLAGCTLPFPGSEREPAASKAPGVEIAPPSGIDEAAVRDKPEYYQNDVPDSVVTMYLTVRRGNDSENTNHSWSEVNAHSTYYYDDNDLARFQVEGLLQVGDESGPLPGEVGYNAVTPNATVQVRGKTTSTAPQKSYKIRLKKDKGKWREQRTIILNKHVFDTVRFRNKLSYDMMSGIPELLGARTQFVRLYVCDQTDGDAKTFSDYGLYTQVEQMNKRYLRNHGLDESGQLYKAQMFEFFRYEDELKLSTDESYDKKQFEQRLEIKGSEDHTKLLAMLDELNNYAIPIEQIMEKHFDEENYFTWLAYQMLIGNFDVNTQNFYLYSPANGVKWYFISWDNDGAWTHGTANASQSGYNYEQGVSQFWGAVLHQRVLKQPQYRKKLDDKVQALRAVLTKEKIAERVEQYRQVVRPYIGRMPDMQYGGISLEKFDQETALMPDQIEYSYQMYLESLNRPMPFYLEPPVAIGGQMQFTWAASYDFDDEEITYQFELASDRQFTQVLQKTDDVSIPQVMTAALPPGQYFYRVTAVNASGKTQSAMEKYIATSDTIHYGICAFYVQPDGTVAVE